MNTEAPEKIYIVNDDLNIKREWYKTKQVGFDTTEYIRTDAFIEKAATWFADRYQANGSYLCADDIEDFEKYMREG